MRNYRPDSRGAVIALVSLLTLVGLGLRLYRLTNQSLWTDEVSSITVARAPLGKIFDESVAVNNSLPTYFYLLRWVLGDARSNVEARVRLPSALAGALSIPAFAGVVYLWQRQRKDALVAGLLLAINPLHIWYSQEARAYALMLFFGLLTLLFFELALLRNKGWYWVGYVVSALAAFALHKTAIIFPLGCGLWHGWQIARQRLRLREYLIHLPILIAAALVMTLRSHVGPPRPNSVLEIGYTLMTFAGGYSFGPSLAAIQWQGPRIAVMQNLAQVVILLVALGLVAAACLKEWRRLVFGRATGLFVLALLVVAVYAIASGFSYNVRYALPGLFGFLALAASAANAKIKPWLGRVAVAELLVIGLWADAQWFYTPAYRKTDSRAVARWLVENRDRIKTWTVLPGYLSKSVEWYLRTEPDVLSRSIPAKEDQTTSFPPVPDVLIMGRRDHLVRPDEIIASFYAATGGVQVIRSFAGLEVYARDAKSSH